jgi:hypothetical protein
LSHPPPCSEVYRRSATCVYIMSKLYHKTSVGEGFVEGCLERIGGDDPEEEQLFRDLWEDETQREVVVESLRAYSVR